MSYYYDEGDRIECRLLSERVVVCAKDHGSIRKGQHARKIAAIVDGEFQAWYEPLEPDLSDEEYEELLAQHREDEAALAAEQIEYEALSA